MTQEYRLQKLALKKVGVFEDIRITFNPIKSAIADEKKAEIHLFTGPNGCGKSTLLYAIAEIFGSFHAESLIRRRLRGVDSRIDFAFANDAGCSGLRRPEEDTANNFINGPFGASYPLANDTNKGHFFSYSNQSNPWDSVLAKYKQSTESFSISNSHSQTQFPFAVFAYSGQRTLTSIQLGAIQEIQNSPFESALSFDGTARPQVLLQWIANNRTQAALARQDSDFLAAEQYDLALNRITALIEDICDLKVSFHLQRAPLAVNIQINGASIQFDGLPDGLKSIISWVADLSLRLEGIPWVQPCDAFLQPIILLLDEVDIHLHPKWQRRILPAVQKLLPNAQIFVSTHSPFVVGSVEDAWVYRLPEPGTSSDSIELEGIPSAAGKSYRLILDEIFGIEGEFDVETETLFKQFYEMRAQFLLDKTHQQELLVVARELSKRGDETAQIIARELRQLSRLSGVEVNLA